MAVTVTSGASIRLPAEDSNYAANNIMHWKCDELSGTIVDSGQNPRVSAVNLGNVYGGGTITYNQTMVTGLTGIKFNGKHAYGSAGQGSRWGYNSANGEADYTIEFFVRIDTDLTTSNDLAASGNISLWTIMNFAGTDDRNFFPRIIRNTSTGEYGIRDGHNYSAYYSNYPGGNWNYDGAYNISDNSISVGDTFHVAFTRVKGGSGVGDIKIYIDGVDQGHSVTYISAPTAHNWQDTGNWNIGRQAASSNHYVLGGRSNNSNGLRGTLSNVAVWDMALTDFSGGGGGSVVPPLYHHYDKNLRG